MEPHVELCPWSQTRSRLQGMLERPSKTYAPHQKWDRALPATPPRAITPRGGSPPLQPASSIWPCHGKSHKGPG